MSDLEKLKEILELLDRVGKSLIELEDESLKAELLQDLYSYFQKVREKITEEEEEIEETFFYGVGVYGVGVTIDGDIITGEDVIGGDAIGGGAMPGDATTDPPLPPSRSPLLGDSGTDNEPGPDRG